MYDNFLFRAKRTVYKWWCIVYKPVYKLTHNGNWPMEKQPEVKYAAPKQAPQPAPLDAQALADAVLDTNRQSQHNIDDLVSEAAHMSAEPTASAPAVNAEPDISSTNSALDLDPEEIPAGVDDDVLARANEIMARLNREAAEDEEKKQREIEAAKEKAAEQERLAAILKSTERNIDAFIQEGLSKQHQQDDGN